MGVVMGVREPIMILLYRSAYFLVSYPSSGGGGLQHEKWSNFVTKLTSQFRVEYPAPDTPLKNRTRGEVMELSSVDSP